MLKVEIFLTNTHLQTSVIVLIFLAAILLEQKMNIVECVK